MAPESASQPVAEVVTPELEALARGLEYDPVRIYNYVHDQIRHVLYFGSKKGAQLTLLEQSGNDFDQCALLVALLRAAGYSPTYQFGILQMPYDSGDHRDVKHWLNLSLANTNWNPATLSYVHGLLSVRGYPDGAYWPFDNTNILGFHRVWVKLPIGGTNYFLDPAFKVSEPMAGVDVPTAMGYDSNALWTAAGGGGTSDFITNLSEVSVVGRLRNYTTNLLDWLEGNQPNASVDEVAGGWRIEPASVTQLPETLAFPTYTGGGFDLLEWEYLPTNLMARLSIEFASTNYHWFTPELQGQRLALTFSAAGLAELSLEDEIVMTAQSSGGSRIDVVLSVDHPHGTWDTDNNTLINEGWNDQSVETSCQRTNASYALTYAFEASPEWLRTRQQRLDRYRQQGLGDGSRQVVCETLNLLGLGWMEQTELTFRQIGRAADVLTQNHHRLGSVAQEAGRGYYLDMGLEVRAIVSSAGNSTEDIERASRAFDLDAYFGSALEHAIIEQLQRSNLVAASTVKMLQLANTNSVKVFLADSNNWTVGANVRGQLTNYNLPWLDDYIAAGYSLLVPRDGGRSVAGAGSWAGCGLVARLATESWWNTGMLIGGGYNGGYVSRPNATVDPGGVSEIDEGQPDYFDPNGAFVWTPSSAEPVRMSDGAYELTATDLSVGQPEPRGFSFTRSYSSARRHHNAAGLAHGWTHNYFFRLAELSAPEAGLGQTTPAQMAPMLVATRAAWEMYRTEANPKNWLLTALIAKWGIDQLINNAVSVTLGADTVQFVRQPDGRITPPANCTMSLLRTNATHWLEQRHGNLFKFDASGRLTNIVDRYGQGMVLTYNSSNWVTQATDWKNRSLTLNYSGTPLRLASVSDSSGRVVSFGYTTNAGQLDLASVTDPEGKTRSLVYDTNHQMIVVKDALNRVVASNVYDGFGRVIEQYSQGDANQRWRFFWSGFENVEEDPTGANRRYFFDDKSRSTGVENALAQRARLLYDGQDHVVMTVSPLNETNRFEFDGRHNLLRSVDPLGFTNRFEYDGQDHRLAAVDARGNTSRFAYNAQHSLTGHTNGAGDWTTFAYNADGTLLSRAVPSGATSYGYDSWGQLSSATYPGGLGGEGFQNNSLGDVTQHTNPRGFVTGFQYNARRELTNTVAPTNLTTTVTFDAVGNVANTTDARGFVTSNTWSATRKLLSTTLPATPQGGPVVSNIYDSRDLLARTLDPLQRATLYTNDAAQRLASVTDPLLRTTRFGYDGDGRRTASTNAANEVARQEWSARGEPTRSTDGENRLVQRAHDAAGNQVTLTNRNGKRWQFQFDAANRLTNTITPLNRQTQIGYDNRGLVSIVREPSTQAATNLYDAKGRLTNRTDSVGAITYRYDANNNVTNAAEQASSLSWTFDAYDRVSSYTDADGNVIQYRHDANGNLTNLVYPGNRNVYYAFDSLNRLTNVTDWSGRQTALTYDLANHLTSITRPNGSQRLIGCDAAGQATNILEKFANNYPIALFRLNWNTAGRVGWEFAAPLPHTNAPPARTMTFDEDNRLATFNGNAVTHDADGNLTYGPLTNSTLVSYSYNARNQLLSAGGLGYGYDPQGNRASLTNGTNVVRFVVNPNAALSQVLMRVRPGVTNYYIHGLGLLYEITETATTTNTLTYHYDYRGSTVALTDGSGRVTDRAEYSAYGATTYRAGTNDTPFLFNGRYGVQTDANGLLYMRARYYNPYLCRFLNADPAGFSGGLNFYAYADGNPVSLIDPFGLQGMIFTDESHPAAMPVYSSLSELPSALREYQPTPFDNFINGVYVGGTVAMLTVAAAPVAVSGLVAVGVPTTTASAAATGAIGVAGAAGGIVTVYDAGQNAFSGNWNNVAYDVGLLGGGALVGGLGGGRYIADNVSPSPSTVPRSWNPFTADRGYEFVRNPELPWITDRWNWLGTGPTPSSGGGAAMAIGSGAGLLFQPPATSGSWVNPWAGQSFSTGK
jgi:RHS repeat-associated protein